MESQNLGQDGYWQVFASTGNIEYYLRFKGLSQPPVQGETYADHNDGGCPAGS